ncbi:MAG: hypothetical protein JO250_11995 [Armatimonadetes bacterium]|nr:hypothetical protein [Armatimonadota bacterium]
MKQKYVPILLTLGAFLAGGPAAQARRHHHRHHHAAASPRYSWEGDQPDMSPVLVQPYVLPADTDPERANFLRKMHLEDGMFVKSARRITRRDVGSRDLFILDITQSLEGGFDSVNLYDRGVLSWGIMQWTARTGSLAQALVFIKRRLWATKRRRLWDKVFVANGLDADPDGLIVYGKRLATPQDVRRAFRGTMQIGKYDPKLMTHWATVMARAGRQPAVAALEVEYAGHVVDAVLKKRLAGLPYHAPGRAGLTVADLAANDPYAEALVFALWTNNPRHANSYVEDAARAARGVSDSDDPALWKPGAFSNALLRLCHGSRFGNWRTRAALIEARAEAVRGTDVSGLTPFERQYQTVLAARKAKRALEMANQGGGKSQMRKAGKTRLAKKPSSQ